MKAIWSTLLLSVAVLFLAVAPGSALAKGKNQDDGFEQQQKKGGKMKAPFDVPSQGKPEPKTCAGRCDRDRGDCDAMCKTVQGQGAAPCKKACVDVQKQCMDDCKSGG